MEISNFSPYKISCNIHAAKFTNRKILQKSCGKILTKQSDKEVVADGASDVREE